MKYTDSLFLLVVLSLAHGCTADDEDVLKDGGTQRDENHDAGHDGVRAEAPKGAPDGGSLGRAGSDGASGTGARAGRDGGERADADVEPRDAGEAGRDGAMGGAGDEAIGDAGDDNPVAQCAEPASGTCSTEDRARAATTIESLALDEEYTSCSETGAARPTSSECVFGSTELASGLKDLGYCFHGALSSSVDQADLLCTARAMVDGVLCEDIGCGAAAPTAPCPVSQFTPWCETGRCAPRRVCACGNGTFVKEDQWCNGVPQCGNSADESECMTCGDALAQAEVVAANARQCVQDDDCAQAGSELQAAFNRFGGTACDFAVSRSANQSALASQIDAIVFRIPCYGAPCSGTGCAGGVIPEFHPRCSSGTCKWIQDACP